MMNRKRAVSLLCAVCMVCSLAIMTRPAPVYASTNSEKLEQIQQEKKELEQKIKEVRENKSKTLEEKALMDQRNDKLRTEISLLQQQMDETETRIAELTAQEEQQYALFCQQVRAEEERGTVSYWSVLFKSASFTDLLARLDFVNEVMDYDRQVISDLQETRRQLNEDKAALEEQKTELVSTQQELQEQIDAATALIQEYEKTEAGHNAMLKEAEEDEEYIQELIRKEQQQNPDSGSPGSYAWPSNNSHSITDSYGWRICPFHGKEFHNGIDIDARRGTPVLAANSGRVIQAGWNGGYGYSVMIAHSDGLTTLYGHMDSVAVSVGQEVTRGQTVGTCGNTGNSNGAHIHFTMYKGGTTVNPLDYLP